MNRFTLLVAALFATGELLLALGCGSNKPVEKANAAAAREPPGGGPAAAATPSKTAPLATPLAPPRTAAQAAGVMPPAAWKEFRADDGSFTITFPGDPKTSEKATLTQTRHMVDVDGPASRKWGLAYTDYLLTPQPEALKSSLSKEGRQFIADTSIRVGNYPGRDFAFAKTANGQKFYCWNRFVLVGKRLYHMVIVSCDEDPVDEVDRKKFFDSFKLTPDKPE